MEKKKNNFWKNYEKLNKKIKKTGIGKAYNVKDLNND